MTTGIPYFKWRGGRPRWEPGPGLRAQGLAGVDLKDEAGNWLSFFSASARAAEINQRLPITASRVHNGEGPELLAILAAANIYHPRRNPLSDIGTGEFIYIFSMEARWAKIGFSTNPARRFQAIAQSLPLALRVHLVARGTMRDERALHRAFAQMRLKNEWFKVSAELGNWLEQISFSRSEVAPPKSDECQFVLKRPH